MRVSDRSRYEEYFKCPRKRYYAYEYGGRGIQGMGVNEDLAFGSGIHNGMEELIITGDMDLALKRLEAEIADCTGETADGYSKYDEWMALGTGMLMLFNKNILPKTREEFDIKDTELEIVLELSDNLIWMTRIDGHLHRKIKGNNLPYVWEYKTSATNYADELVNSAQHNFQFLMEGAALQEYYEQKGETIYVGGTQLVVLLKGQKTWASDAEKKRGIQGQRRISPFTYAYFKGDPFADPTSGCEWWPKYKAGWTRLPVWVYPGLDRWYSAEFFFDNDHKAREYLDGLIFQPQPITLDRKQFDNLRDQIVEVENNITAGVEGILRGGNNEKNTEILLNAYFPQNFLNCHKDGGFNKKDCPYVGVCHEGDDPHPDGGIYRWREPNHPFESNVLVPLEE